MAEPRNPSKNRKPNVADASAEDTGRPSPTDESGRMASGDVSAGDTERAKLEAGSGRSTGTERAQVNTLTVPATGPNQAEMAMTGGRGAKGDADHVYAGDGTHGEGKSDAQEAQEAAQQEAESPVPRQWTRGRVRPAPDPVEAHFSPQHGHHTIRWPSGNEVVPPAELSQMIAEAAYYLAERRGFHAGYEIEDWLAAEAEINARLREIAKAATVGTPAG